MTEVQQHPIAVREDTGREGQGAAVEVLRRMFDEGFSTGDTAVVDELCSPDLIEHQFGLSGSGVEALEHVKAAIVDVHTAVPDAVFTIEDWAARGDTVWVRVRAVGTASGPFFGPPSNRPLEFTVVDVARVVDGRIVEHWGVPDRFAMLAQTGVLDRLTAPPQG
ncbi:ester cyclase [Nakamurella lactea]|uniref:ester cyclase n=1 Tax=Nakamurella lactea TaxID=459515 RepID=UPI00041A4895|nr:ester cyclase [Nakamurella lactea]